MTDRVERGYETSALQRWRRATDLPLTILAIGSLPLLLLELERSELPRGDRLLLDLVNVVVLVRSPSTTWPSWCSAETGAATCGQSGRA